MRPPIGAVPINAENEDVASVLSAADSACGAAKESGRNRVHCFEENDIDLMRRRRHPGESVGVGADPQPEREVAGHREVGQQRTAGRHQRNSSDPGTILDARIVPPTSQNQAGAAGPGSRSNLRSPLLNRGSGGKGLGREPANDAPGIDVLGVHSGAAVQAGQCPGL